MGMQRIFAEDAVGIPGSIDSGPVVMVTGSRSWRDSFKIDGTLDLIHSYRPNMELIHGGAAGADRLAYEWALDRGVHSSTFAPDYSRPSPQRYHERNDRMLDRADYVVAFWDGQSCGTKSVIDKAQERRLSVKVIR